MKPASLVRFYQMQYYQRHSFKQNDFEGSRNNCNISKFIELSKKPESAKCMESLDPQKSNISHQPLLENTERKSFNTTMSRINV